MKKLTNLKGVKTLGKVQQKAIFGGNGLDEFGDPAGGTGSECKSCSVTSDCPNSGCVNWVGPDCHQAPCGCGSYCI